MADFCRQCSLELFGEDFGDHARPDEKLDPGKCFYVICEECGYVGVNEKGECCMPLFSGCLKGHGDEDWNVLPYDETERMEAER